MAGKTATLTVKIVSDASQAGRGFDQAESKVAGFQRGLDRASVAAGGALLAIGGLAKASFDAASALQQASGAVDAVFGANADKVHNLAKGAADSIGLATSEYSNFAALIGAQLGGMGIAADQLVPKTDELIKLGADLAAQYGGTTADAVSALSSALKGERDPLERYAIGIKQADVNARIAAMGLDTSTTAAQKNADAVATMAIIAEQAGSAVGASAREYDTAAAAQQRLSANWEDAKASLGEALLPVVAAAAEALKGLAGWAEENSGTVQVLVGVVAGLAAAILLVNGALAAYRAIAVVATAVQWAFNAAMLANPVGLIILAVVALVAAIIICWNKFEGFRNVVTSVAQAIGGAITSFIGNPLNFIKSAAEAVGGAFTAAFGAARSAVQWVIDKVVALMRHLRDMPVIGDLIGLFSAPAAPGGAVPAPAPAGVFGATTAPVYGAGLISPVGGAGPSAGRGPAAPQTVLNVTINGAVDRVGTARELQRLLADYGVITGQTRTVSVGR